MLITMTTAMDTAASPPTPTKTTIVRSHDKSRSRRIVFLKGLCFSFSSAADTCIPPPLSFARTTSTPQDKHPSPTSIAEMKEKSIDVLNVEMKGPQTNEAFHIIWTMTYR
mmetsp:Transcript_29845/g.65693  ORF Transcript_29845/g.65693 Transcript_29845/m.65693 type:complete len:110 (-) Transcript_29845:95-424(-)